jgi:nucleoside-diphosphate-sugar epimerase
MKILITGSEGYIGQHLVKKLRIVDTLDINGNLIYKIDIRNQFDIDEEYNYGFQFSHTKIKAKI